MLFAIIKSYENNTLISDAWIYKVDNDDYELYQKMMELTDNDHEISAEAAAWSMSASEDDVYCFREGEIEMIKLY